VSVDPFIIRAKHYGSAYAMTDFTSKTTVAHLTTSFIPTDKLRLFGTLTYSQSKAALDEVVMPDVSDRLDKDLTNDVLDPDLTHQNFVFDEMHMYSDLDYKLIRVNLGFEYRLTPKIVWTTDGDLADLTDNQGYVHGNESGSYIMVRTGMRLEF